MCKNRKHVQDHLVSGCACYPWDHSLSVQSSRQRRELLRGVQEEVDDENPGRGLVVRETARPFRAPRLTNSQVSPSETYLALSHSWSRQHSHPPGTARASWRVHGPQGVGSHLATPRIQEVLLHGVQEEEVHRQARNRRDHRPHPPARAQENSQHRQHPQNPQRRREGGGAPRFG